MERKGKVTQGAVNAACEKLQAAGQTVTVNAVIDNTGGSFSTVGPMVKAWREEQAAQASAVLEMPDAVVLAMQKAAADIWDAASGLAGELVERTRQEAGEAIAKAKGELAEYTGEISRLENELEQARQQAAEQEKRLAEAQAHATELKTQNAALASRLNDRDKELDRLRADYAALQAELVAIAKEQAKKPVPRKKGAQEKP
jgi:chromosome segregation ATPase